MTSSQNKNMNENDFSNIGFDYGVKPFFMLVGDIEFSDLFKKADCRGMLYIFEKSETEEMIPVQMAILPKTLEVLSTEVLLVRLLILTMIQFNLLQLPSELLQFKLMLTVFLSSMKLQFLKSLRILKLLKLAILMAHVLWFQHREKTM